MTNDPLRHILRDVRDRLRAALLLAHRAGEAEGEAPLPPPRTVQTRKVTDIQRYRALRGSGDDRFKLSTYK